MPSAAPIFKRYGNVVAAIATIAACDIAMGLTFSLLPLILESRGVPAKLIGLNSAMGPLGILVAGPFLPSIVARFGSKRVSAWAIATIIVSLLAYPLFPQLPAWFVIRFIFGIAAGTLFTVSEAWILAAGNEGNRGRLMGIYTSVLAVTFAIGPLILPYTGIHGWLPWIIGIVCVAISAGPLMLVKTDDSSFRHKSGGSVAGFVLRAPLLLGCVVAVTLFDSVLLSFFQIWGLRNGLDLHTASWLLSAGIVGNALLQFAVGLFADKWSRIGVIVTASVMTIVLSMALLWTVQSWLVWPVFIVLGTSCFATYTVALAVLGDRFTGRDLIAGTAAIAAMWGIGGTVGPSIAGVAIDVFGIDAVPFAFAAPYVLLLIGLVLAGGRLVREEARA